MTLTFIQFVLPILSGYALYLLVAGSFNPLIRPKRPAARPAWFLGLWIGIACTIAMILMFQMVNPLALETLKVALMPTLVLLGLALLPGFGVYAWYCFRVKKDQMLQRQLAQDKTDFSTKEFDYLALSSEPDFNAALHENQIHMIGEPDALTHLNHTINVEETVNNADQTHDQAFEREYNRLRAIAEKASSEKKVLDTEYDNAYALAFNQVTNNPCFEQGELLGLSKNKKSNLRVDRCDLNNEMDRFNIVAAKPTVHTGWSSDSTATNNNDSWSNELSNFEEFNIAFYKSFNHAIKSKDDHSVLTKSSNSNAERDIELGINSDFDVLLTHELAVREQQIRNKFEAAAKFEKGEYVKEVESIISEVTKTSVREQKLRLETEKHLRITRKALSRLEADSRNVDTSKADELISLEQELEEKIRVTAKTELALVRETTLREQIESELIKSKQSTLAARSDSRKNTAARAKVLATAQKAIAFARQTIDARTKVETDLENAYEQIKLHQTTISSLIDTLDQEKSKSREEVSYLSKQLMRKEIELEKKSIGAGNLTSRLVKKVARARPVT